MSLKIRVPNQNPLSSSKVATHFAAQQSSTCALDPFGAWDAIYMCLRMGGTVEVRS